MNQIRRFYNQNRKKIWGLIIFVAFLFAILQLANLIAKNENDKEIQSAHMRQQNIIANNNYTNNTQTGENKTTKTSTEEELIKEFVEYCNKRELENAYNMLSNECKEQMFKDIETFETIYYNSAFEGKTKDSSIEKWGGNTYLVYYRESALALGKSTKQNQKGDYITCIKDKENNYKLNINSYIGYKEINKAKESDDIKMNVVSKNVYMNYEEYKIIVENNTKDKIVLDSLYYSDSLYIKDANGTKFPAYNHELSTELLTIDKNHTRELKIKFYNSYTLSRNIKALCFSNLSKGNKIINFSIEF